MAATPSKDNAAPAAPDVHADAPTQPQADNGLTEAQVVAHLITGVPVA